MPDPDLPKESRAGQHLIVTAMLIVMGLVAMVVYERVGMRILRRGWFNMDLAWSLVLIASGAITLFTAL